MRRSVLFLTPLLASACVTDDVTLAENAAYVESTDIDNWSNASQFHTDRAAYLGCTGTRIGRNWVLTALHCFPHEGMFVQFYDSAVAPGARSGSVVQVVNRPGTNFYDFTDTDGNFADIALLRMEADQASASYENEMSGLSATLAWEYPGAGFRGTKVGAGEHYDDPANASRLREVDDIIDTGGGAGEFWTIEESLNHGDSGGPFYFNNKVLGVLNGEEWSAADGWSNNYTSIPRHLDWILDVTGYRWAGLPTQDNQRYTGREHHSFTGTARECKYACENTQDCEAFNYHSPTDRCTIMTDVTGLVAATNYGSALRYGRSGTRGRAVGYLRSDGTDVVVHVATGGAIRELYPSGGSWTSGHIQAGGPPLKTNGKVSAYRRSDGINTVVYRSTTDQLVELHLSSDGKWKSGVLTTSVPVGGDPVGFVRGDGASAIVYRGTNNKIIELRLATRGWVSTDLTTKAGALDASGDPGVFVRPSGLTSIVYRASSKIIELYSTDHRTWSKGSPSDLAVAPGASGNPFGYTSPDGLPHIAYRNSSNGLTRLSMSSSGAWTYANIGGPNAMAGDPFGYVRNDGVTSLLYRLTSGYIMEYANNQLWTLPTPVDAASDPTAYVRGDGYNSVLHALPAYDVGEIWWRPGQSAWLAGNLGE